MPPDRFTGIPLVGSALVPPGQVYQVDGRLVFHSRPSRRERWRRPHGRTNGPRRRVVKVVRYEPDLVRIKAAAR